MRNDLCLFALLGLANATAVIRRQYETKPEPSYEAKDPGYPTNDHKTDGYKAKDYPHHHDNKKLSYPTNYKEPGYPEGYYPPGYPEGYYPPGYPDGYEEPRYGFDNGFPEGYPDGYYPPGYPDGYPDGYYPPGYPNGYPDGYYPPGYPDGYEPTYRYDDTAAGYPTNDHKAEYHHDDKESGYPTNSQKDEYHHDDEESSYPTNDHKDEYPTSDKEAHGYKADEYHHDKESDYPTSKEADGYKAKDPEYPTNKVYRRQSTQWRPRTHHPEFFSLRIDEACNGQDLDGDGVADDCQFANFAIRLEQGLVIATPYNRWWDPKLPIFFVDDDTKMYTVSRQPLQLYVDGVTGALRYNPVGWLPPNAIGTSFYKTGNNPLGIVGPSPAQLSWPSTQGNSLNGQGPWWFCALGASGQFQVFVAEGNYGQAGPGGVSKFGGDCTQGNLAAIDANPWQSSRGGRLPGRVPF